jgi:ribonuclease G
VNGEIEAPILIIDRINSDLERVLKRTKEVVLNTHTFVAAYLTKGFHHYVQNGILNIKMGENHTA